MAQKIVINRCWGGYGLSEAAYKKLGLTWDGYGYEFRNDRANPDLVAVVEALGDAANGGFANLKIVEVPDGVEWVIDDYDGMERVEEQHRSWS